MLYSTHIFALLFAGLSQAAPAALSNASTPEIASMAATKPSTAVSPAQSTSVPQNGTTVVKFSASTFTDIAPIVNPNVTFQSFIKPSKKPYR
jgi:hypothetical protein